MVSPEDITFIRFTHTGLLGMMVLAILLAVAGAACLLFGDWDDAALAVGLCLLGGAALFLLIYFVTRSSVFLVAFPGGGFAFNVHDYPAADIRDFQRRLHLLKDRVREGART